jgi:Uma2 family endonuclease
MVTPHLKNVTPHSDAGQDVRHTDPDTVHYPIDDDEPLAESEHQLFPLTYAHAALTGWYEGDPTTWVGADMFLYYEEGVTSSVVAPDVFVVTRTHKRHRRNIFQTWVEGRVPDLVLEIMSSTSVRRDTVTKYELYRELGVREYWIYDPTEEGYLEPRLRGYMLADGEYRPIEVREVDGRHIGVSEVLGLELHADAEWFRFFNPISGEYLPDSDERKRAQEAAEARAEQDRAAREEAEARLAAMEAELRRLRDQQRPG